MPAITACARSPPIAATTIAACASASAIPGTRRSCSATCWAISPRPRSPGSTTSAAPSPTNAGAPRRGEDASFQNKVHLAIEARGWTDVKRPGEAGNEQGVRPWASNGHRRPAECRQVDALQRADADRGGAGGELSRSAPSSRMSATSAVPDERLDALAGIASSAQIIPTRLTFVDIAGLVRGASKGEGLGNQFLANIREVDAIAHVVRCFEDGDVTHVEGKIDPDRRHRDDRDRADARRSRQPREARRPRSRRRRSGGDKEAKETLDLVNRALVAPARGQAGPARRAQGRGGAPLRDARPPDARSRCSTSAMSRRPRPTRATRSPAKVFERARRRKAPRRSSSRPRSRARSRCCRRRAEGLSRRGRPRGARPQPRHPRRLRASRPRSPISPSGRRRRAPGRSPRAPARRRRPASSIPISRRASSAPRPSPMTTTSRLKGEAGARDAGKLRLEGKDYVVQDGDVLHFRFNT